MKRQLYQQLISWKNSSRRKPLLLQGARQVGKTYLVNAFGKKEFKHYIYLNLEQSPDLRSLFTGNLSAENIINNISLYLGQKISAKNTLICFDEVQTVPEAISSLKYFYEQAPEYHIIATGSLLGVSVGKPTSFPVGKVNFMTLYPMNFAEYLMAFGEELLVDELQNKSSLSPLAEILHEKLSKHLKMYFYLGGMPEVLQDYLQNQDIAVVRTIQNEILEAYRRDFSKYTDGSQAIKTSELWHSIPNQLAKENKKFKYSDVIRNARAVTFAQTIEWLKETGLIHLAYNISTPKLPLSGYAERNKFKIYVLDTGLLGAMLNLSSDIILHPNQLYTEYNGAFVENYVAQELTSQGQKELFYWTSRSDAEVDFVLEKKSKIYPIEVKSGSSRTLKSLRSYSKKYEPEYIFRFSPRNFTLDDDLVNVPLYGICALESILMNLPQTP